MQRGWDRLIITADWPRARSYPVAPISVSDKQRAQSDGPQSLLAFMRVRG